MLKKMDLLNSFQTLFNSNNLQILKDQAKKLGIDEEASLIEIDNN
jgi:hypothetical protein